MAANSMGLAAVLVKPVYGPQLPKPKSRLPPGHLWGWARRHQNLELRRRWSHMARQRQRHALQCNAAGLLRHRRHPNTPCQRWQDLSGHGAVCAPIFLGQGFCRCRCVCRRPGRFAGPKKLDHFSSSCFQQVLDSVVLACPRKPRSPPESG